MDSRELGAYGEEQAALYLRSKGYDIIKMNFRCRTGEIDIIASDSDYLVFAEVKLRKNGNYGTAAEYVMYSKQRRILSAARYYLSGKKLEKQPRFDVVEVIAPQGEKEKPEINHIEDAFNYGSVYNR